MHIIKEFRKLESFSEKRFKELKGLVNKNTPLYPLLIEGIERGFIPS